MDRCLGRQRALAGLHRLRRRRHLAPFPTRSCTTSHRRSPTCSPLAAYREQALGVEIEEIRAELRAGRRGPARIIEQNVAHEIVGDRRRAGAIGRWEHVLSHGIGSICARVDLGSGAPLRLTLNYLEAPAPRFADRRASRTFHVGRSRITQPTHPKGMKKTATIRTRYARD